MICIDAFKNLSITYRAQQLELGPCCVAKHTPVSAIDFYDSSLVSIREKWSKDHFPTECAACQTRASNRIDGSNRWYADHNIVDTVPELIRIDYWVGDTCNLQCIICGPDNSSSWKQELGLKKEKRTVNYLWKNIDLTKLQFIHFTGGEPLLDKNHVDFLYAIPNKGNVSINYNTNGTILPSDELINLWAQFKLVQLDFSIDDIGPRFEYIRYPAKWDNVVNNLNWFLANTPVNTMFSVNTSVGILNQHTLNELQQWISVHFSSNRLGDKTEHRFQDVHGILSKTSNPHAARQFLDQCDLRRGSDWRSLFPELS